VSSAIASCVAVAAQECHWYVFCLQTGPCVGLLFVYQYDTSESAVSSVNTGSFSPQLKYPLLNTKILKSCYG